MYIGSFCQSNSYDGFLFKMDSQQMQRITFPLKISMLGDGTYEIFSQHKNSKLQYSGKYIEYDKWEMLYKYRSIRKWYPGGVKRNDSPEYTTETFITCRKKLSDFANGLRIYPDDLNEDFEINIKEITTSKWTDKEVTFTTIVPFDNYTTVNIQKPNQNASSNNIVKTSPINRVDKLDFLRDYRGKYPHEANLFENGEFANRLKNLIEISKFNLIETFTTEIPVEVENDIVSIEGMKPHYGGAYDYIIVYDIDRDIVYTGIREDYKTKIYSESGEVCQQIIDWRDNTKPIRFTQEGKKQLFTEEEKKSVYEVKANETFFYAESNFSKRKNPYLGYGEIFVGTRSENGFVYSVVTDKDHGQAEGWISTSDIDKIEGSELDSYLRESEPNSSAFSVKVDKAFFYTNPNPETKRSEYLEYGDKFYEETKTDGFVYTEFVNANGVRVKGWIRLVDVNEVTKKEP